MHDPKYRYVIWSYRPQMNFACTYFISTTTQILHIYNYSYVLVQQLLKHTTSKELPKIKCSLAPFTNIAIGIGLRRVELKWLGLSTNIRSLKTILCSDYKNYYVRRQVTRIVACQPGACKYMYSHFTRGLCLYVLVNMLYSHFTLPKE